MPETAIYELGALSVREASPKGFAVYFAHGIESMPKPLTVPPRTPSSTHPLFDGQEVSSWSNHFRTKTGARRYMLALAKADILPEDRPATHEEVLAIRDWITDQAL